MLKRITLIFALFASIQFANAQCTPDPALNYPGISPNKLPNGIVGQPYSQVISLMVPLDTFVTLQGTVYNVKVDSASVISIENVPSNFGYEADKPTRTWAGGAKGCARLFGTPVEADVKDWVIWVKVLTYFKIVGLSNQFTRLDSSMIDFKVAMPNSLFELNAIQSVPSYPNPAKTEVNIPIERSNSVLVLKVYDLVGKEIVPTYQYDTFSNAIKMDVSSIPQGVYMVKILDGNNRMYQSRIVKE
ncbi:MAG: T9SS type A sorting domain-containing protein [Bacteroidia bacterium]